jgi:hypothetical protein
MGIKQTTFSAIPRSIEAGTQLSAEPFCGAP